MLTVNQLPSDMTRCCEGGYLHQGKSEIMPSMVSRASTSLILRKYQIVDKVVALSFIALFFFSV